MTMKTCGRCHQLIDIENIPSKNGGKSGAKHSSGVKHSYCKPCLSEYKKEAYRNNKEKWEKSSKISKVKRRNIINNFKNVPCKDCGVGYPYYAMQFDHL